MNKTKILAPGIAIVMVLMLTTAAAFLATPVLADPPGPKYVAPLSDNGDRYGQAIFNTNMEDEGCYELEVEVEECMALAETTVDVYLGPTLVGPTLVGTIEVDELGNGKETFCVGGIINTVTVEGAVTLTITTTTLWWVWPQGSGKK